MGPQAILTSPAPAGAAVVLDTNTVLAWLWFCDPAVAGLAAAVEARALTWLATADMRRELVAVLARLPARAQAPGSQPVLAAFDRHTQLLPAAPSALRLRCSDGTDQMFIDLALAGRARWLLSRDRALLKLHRRAAELGLQIRRPDGFEFPG